MPMSPRLLRPRATGFNPASIASLQWWGDASSPGAAFTDDAATTAAGNNDGVAVLRSRLGTNLVQTTQANRPTLITNARNGRPCLRFDGLNDSLAFSSVIQQVLGQHFIAAVNLTNMQTDNSSRLMLERTSATAQNLALYLRASSGVVGGPGSFPHVYWNGGRAIVSSAVTSAAVIRWTFNSSSTAVQVNRNTEATGSAATNLTNWSSVNNSSVQQTAFDFYEGLLFSSLTATDITRVVDYLMKKWSIT